MRYPEALSSVFNDSDQVTRQVWGNRSIYLSLVDYQLCITGFSSAGPDDGLPHPYILTENDYFADDWEVVVDG